MLQYLPGVLILVLYAVLALLRVLDTRRPRRLAAVPPLSVIVPCYNDSAAVTHAVAAIREVCGSNVDLTVVDDCSTDGSVALLTSLQTRYGFRLVLNPVNKGKARTLNEQFRSVRHDVVVFVDSDTLLNRTALHDALTRLQDPGVGAVSCPYVPRNRGLIPRLQHIEYNLLAFIQGAYNLFSVLALWGGCIVIRRKAFEDVGGFSTNAITEDMDLAYKLNAVGWKVEQSPYPVLTAVPATVKAWLKQKVRWSSGAFQCSVTHYRIWLRNPMHLLFMLTLCSLLTLSAANLAADVLLWDRMFEYFTRLNASEGVLDSLKLTGLQYGLQLSSDVLLKLSFTAFALPFVWPLVPSARQAHLLLLVVPFSIIYVPAFSLVSLVGAMCFLQRRKELQGPCRAW